jgi:type IV secretory pathway VirD2 relaxase
MSGEDEFTLRLGKLRDLGAGGGKRFRTELKRAARRLSSSVGKSAFSGAQIARGSGAGRSSLFRQTPHPKFRMRRVVVKVHIARASQGLGPAAFRAHLRYIQRDGVDRDGEGGALYGRDADRIDGALFGERSASDRHQFRFIVSPEDAADLRTQRETVRALMAQAEKDLCTKLDWVAVDHHNTSHPHTHIVVRGKDQLGRDLIIARDYLTEGLRELASVIVTDELGPRRDLEIARAQERDVTAGRLTRLDAKIERLARDGDLTRPDGLEKLSRFERALIQRRLKHLRGLGLASARGDGAFALEEGWKDRLQAIGRDGDRIREIAAAFNTGDGLSGRVYDPAHEQARAIVGRVVSDGPEDELRNRRYLILEAVDGERWHVSLGETLPGAVPPKGSVVEVSPSVGKPRASDRTIARIAALNVGMYSDSLHEAFDPASRADYRLAHIRRLEAMRRAGLVTRDSHGRFAIGAGYLAKAARYETARAGGVWVEVKSWLSVEAQITRRAPVWLDGLDRESLTSKGFGRDTASALSARRAFLEREGWLGEDGQLKPDMRVRLAAEELKSAADGIRGKGAFLKLEAGMSISGKYERPVDLAQGRFALVTRSMEFTLVPWRPELERYRGAEISVKARAGGIHWSMGRARGIGR